MEESANKIVIANVPMPKADKEYPWALPKNCRWFTLQVRDGAVMRIAVESGKVADSHPPYFRLKADSSWDERQLNIDMRYGLPLYFACGSAGKTVEVIMGVFDPDIGGE